MRVYKNEALKAVVVAASPVQAACLLTEELRRFGVDAVISPKSMEEVSKRKAHVVTMVNQD